MDAVARELDRHWEVRSVEKYLGAYTITIVLGVYKQVEVRDLTLIGLQ